MPVTRSQSRLPQMTMAARDADRERWNPLSRPPARLPPIRTQIGPTTNLDRFADRLSPHILVEKVATKTVGRGSYCAIQLNPVSVRIYDSDGSSGRVNCTCDVFRTTGETCVHIQWLTVGLRNILYKVPISEPVGSSTQLSQMLQLIQARELSLPTELNGLRGPDNSPLDTAGIASLGPDREMSVRGDLLCDMLSTFDRHRLPEDFRQTHLFGVTRAPQLEDCLQRDNIYVTIYQMGMIDGASFDALRTTISAAYCNEQYQRKQRLRIGHEFDQLAHQQQAGIGVPASSVRQCADNLRSIADQILEDQDNRKRRQEELGFGENHMMATTLVSMISNVVDRNEDLRVVRSGRALAQKHEHNLYMVLIGDPPHEVGEAFVIDRLRTFPPEDWRNEGGQLKSIKDRIEVDSSLWGKRGMNYASRIGDMLREQTLHDPDAVAGSGPSTAQR